MPQVEDVRHDPWRRTATAGGRAEAAVRPSAAAAVPPPLCSVQDWESCRACRKCAAAPDWIPLVLKAAIGSRKLANAAVAWAAVGKGAGLCPAVARAAFEAYGAVHAAKARCDAAGRAARAVHAARAARVARAAHAVAPGGSASPVHRVICSGTGASAPGGFVWRRVSLSQSSFPERAAAAQEGAGPSSCRTRCGTRGSCRTQSWVRL